jgi:hypothetical protein
MWDVIHPLEVRPYQMEDDFDNGLLYDLGLQYYYYIPCPTYSWFWGYSGWEPGDVLGASFTIGDTPTGPFVPGCPYSCDLLDFICVLDLAGYGQIYPGFFTIEMDCYCSDESGNPAQHIWNSGPLETAFGWNYFLVSPGIQLDQVCQDYVQHPTIIVTMTFTGTEGAYPAVGFDNIGTAVEAACQMHEYACLPVSYPRGWAGGDDPRVHSGYVGRYAFEYWPPLALPDGMCSGGYPPVPYGCVEAAWRLYLGCWGPTESPAAEAPASWGEIKSLYR